MAIPDSSGQVHAVYQAPPLASGTSLAIIDPATGSPGDGQEEISWSVTGPQLLASQVEYTIGSGGITQVVVQLDCPAGTIAINGGITGTTQAVSSGATLLQAGEAFLSFGEELTDNGSRNLGLPRPVNSGASWRMLVNANGAIQDNGDGTHSTIPITITYWVIYQ